MKLITQKKFSWAYNGVRIEEFEAGTEIETEDDELIKVSISEGWTMSADVKAPAAVEAPAVIEATAVVEAPASTKRGRAAK